MDRKGAAGFIGFIGFLSIFVGLPIYFAGEEESDTSCYRDFPAIYTWEETKPALNKIWEDKYITIRECSDMLSVYVEAQKQAERNKVEEAINAVETSRN